MDYARLPFRSVQSMYDRIALLEWFDRQGEASDADLAELHRLKQMVN